MEKVIITADLGHFKAYEVSQEFMGSKKVSLLKSYDSIEGHGKLGDRVSDKAGRFRKGGGSIKDAGQAYGDRHNMELEKEARLIKTIAKDISCLVKKNDCREWYFAAPSRIIKRIVENLDADALQKLAKAVDADLTKTSKSELLAYFE